MNEQQKVGPTVLGRLVLIVFVGACIAGAAYYFRDLVAPGGRQQGMVDIDQFRKVEAPDTQGITTVNEYNYVPGEKLPPVKGVSSYTWDADEKVVQFPINVWIGWLPIVAANHGFAPNDESVFAKKHGFKVNLRLIDDPVVARDAFAAGESRRWPRRVASCSAGRRGRPRVRGRTSSSDRRSAVRHGPQPSDHRRAAMVPAQ